MLVVYCLSVCAFLLASASAQAQLSPLLDCVEELDQATLRANLGFQNLGPDEVEVTAGTSPNSIIPTGPDVVVQGQPSVFPPGRVDQAFTVDFPRTSTVVWLFLASALSVSADDLSERPCLGPALDGISCWDLNGNGANDPAEDLNGDGRFDANDCQGEAGPPGPPGLPGPPGPPGTPGADPLAACATTEKASEDRVAVAQCGPGQRLLTGGGGCDNTLLVDPVVWSVGQIQSSQPAGNGWEVRCRIGHATARAVCCQAP